MDQVVEAKTKPILIIGGSIHHVHIPTEAIKVYAAPYGYQAPETISFLQEKSKECPQLGSPEEILRKILAIDAACIEPVKLEIPVTMFAAKYEDDYRLPVTPDRIPVPKRYSRNKYRR